MTTTRQISAKFAVAAVAVAMIFSAYATPAAAQTDLQAQITALLAQIQMLEAQLTGGADVTAPAGAPALCPYTWTRDLTMGSEGADVMKLQQFLNSYPDLRVAATGAGSAGMETMFFGPATAAAVSKMQVMFRAEVLTPNGLVNPTGYFGPSSRAKANDLCIADATTGEVDEAEEGTDEDEDDSADMTLSGEGTLTGFEIDDEEDEVAEGEEDVVVAIYTLESENGDVELSRLGMSLVADNGTPNEEVDPWDVFEEVSIWIDGDKVASFDASDEDEYLNEDDGTFRFSNLGLFLEEDEEVEVMVAVSVQNSVDGAETTNAAKWAIQATSVRYFDADGVAVTEDVIDEMILGNADAIIFDVVEAGADDEATIESNSNSLDSSILKVEDNRSESKEIAVHTFEIEVDRDSSDLVLEDAYVWVSITNPAGGVASIEADDVVAEITLTIDGKTEEGEIVAATDVAILNAATGRVGYRFQFDELDLDADETYIAVVAMTFEGTDNGTAYDVGTGIQTDVDAQDLDGTQVANQNGARWEVEGADDNFVLTGTDESELHTLNTVVPLISGVDSSISQANQVANSGSIVFEFTIEADEDDVVFTRAQLEAVDTLISSAGTPLAMPTPSLARTGGDTAVETPAGTFTIAKGDTSTFRLTYTFTTGDATNNGNYSINLDTIAGVDVDETSPNLVLSH